MSSSSLFIPYQLYNFLRIAPPHTHSHPLQGSPILARRRPRSPLTTCRRKPPGVSPPRAATAPSGRRAPQPPRPPASGLVPQRPLPPSRRNSQPSRFFPSPSGLPRGITLGGKDRGVEVAGSTLARPAFPAPPAPCRAAADSSKIPGRRRGLAPVRAQKPVGPRETLGTTSSLLNIDIKLTKIVMAWIMALQEEPTIHEQGIGHRLLLSPLLSHCLPFTIHKGVSESAGGLDHPSPLLPWTSRLLSTAVHMAEHLWKQDLHPPPSTVSFENFQ
uniref:serine/arginine repetitive matrix protein 1-like n=1 Tax=Ictidomys tridecemlineatus TaxID=43179 RepID=UPI001A9F2EC7|nr:serine/arginine repetitive matrix protein 1-like [Ictidomys tridecemlineatus]